MTTLGILWFILIAVLICGYFVLDGMDLGTGVLYPFLGKTETDKKLMMRAIGPIWDGNEVWLLTAGGALFAAFAPAYATSFSGFYLAIMLVLFGLIVRVIALEFRHLDPKLSKLYDTCFFVGSLLPALLFGVAVGNVIVGLPLDANGDYTGTFFALLNPFALLCGVLGLVHMLAQGSAWLAVKMPAGNSVQTKAVRLRSAFAFVELVVFALVSLVFFTAVAPNSAVGLGMTGLGFAFVAVYVVSTLAVVLLAGKQGRSKDLPALICCGLGCAGLVGTMAATLFPYLIPANVVELSITVASAASSDTALAAMTVIACIGVPLVLIYHVIIYRTYRGRLTEEDVKH